MARAWILLCGVGTVGVGLIYALAPEVMTDPTGFGDLKPEALTDLRATYGGLQLALGLYVLWLARDASRYGDALRYIGVTFLCLAGSRTLGLIVDGERTTLQVIVAVGEISAAAVSLALLPRT